MTDGLAGAPSAIEASYEDRPVNPERLRAVREHAGPVALDVGCGNGAYVRELRGERTILGSDLRRGRGWDRTLPLAIADAACLGVRDASVDTVLAFEVLEHLPDPSSALREWRRVARRNLIVTTPNCELSDGMVRSNLIFRHWIDPTHVNFFDLASLGQLVEEAGFSVSHATTINRIELAPLLREAFRLPASLERFLQGASRRVARPYRMTCLMVAETSAER